MASKGKAAKPAPVPQDSDPIVEQLQRELKQQGYYAGPIDGAMGKSTRDAVTARDAKKASDEARDIERERVRQSGATTDVNAAETARQTQTRAARDAAANTPLGMAAQAGAVTAAPLVGTGVGLSAGNTVNALMDASQASKNAVLAGAAQDRVSGLTSLEGARAGARLSGAMPSSNPLLRVGGRMVPHAILGGLAMGKGGAMLAEGDSDAPFFPEMFNRGAGLGLIGAGGGILKRGAQYAVAPGVAPDARSIAIINSNRLMRNPGSGSAPMAANAIDVTSSAPAALPSPASPAADSAPRPGTHAAIKAQAKTMQIPGRSSMNKEQLASAVADAIKAQGTTRAKRLPKVTGAVGPALAAGLAYAATPDQAQAADGSDPGINADALANAGVAGTGAYAVQKGIDALPAAAGGAVRAAGAGLAPSNIDAMTDYSPDELATAANWQARNLPSWARSEGVENAYQMAQVPEPSPVRQEDGGSFDDHMAELQSLLQQIGQGQDAGPMANAAASQQVASMPAPSPQSWAQAYPQNRLMANR